MEIEAGGVFLEYYEIDGGIPLRGEYEVRGAKNAALPILAATLCKGGIHEIYGCPEIGDVHTMIEILRSLGAAVEWSGDCICVDSRFLTGTAVPPQLMSQLRSSVFLLGSLLARTEEAVICRPGGCRIGSRPIDIHIAGLQRLGFDVREEGELVAAAGRCRGGRIRLAYPSVGATENLMMAALSGSGYTVLENCAAEPEIEDLQGFLRSCGYRVYGAGTSCIHIEGGRGLHDAMYFIMGDRIETATYMMALAGTGGDGILTGTQSVYVSAVTEVLERMGAQIKNHEDRIQVTCRGRLKSPGTVITQPYPGFPTDCQPQLMSLVTCAEGTATIREEIFENRFTHKKDLMKMGANIETCGKNAIIKGVGSLRGCPVRALDLRGGAALVLAGLMAEGTSLVRGIEHIERGYEDFAGGIRKLGGNIEKKITETKKTDESADETADSDSGNRGGRSFSGITPV